MRERARARRSVAPCVRRPLAGHPRQPLMPIAASAARFPDAGCDARSRGPLSRRRQASRPSAQQASFMPPSRAPVQQSRPSTTLSPGSLSKATGASPMLLSTGRSAPVAGRVASARDEHCGASGATAVLVHRRGQHAPPPGQGCAATARASSSSRRLYGTWWRVAHALRRPAPGNRGCRRLAFRVAKDRGEYHVAEGLARGLESAPMCWARCIPTRCAR